jgi:hypothetical protein
MITNLILDCYNKIKAGKKLSASEKSHIRKQYPTTEWNLEQIKPHAERNFTYRMILEAHSAMF